jgi:hypothetical protein
MNDLATPTVTLTTTRRKAIFRRGAWSATFPVAELPKWRDFYAGLMKRGPVQAKAYGPWLPAIDAAINELAVKS